MGASVFLDLSSLNGTEQQFRAILQFLDFALEFTPWYNGSRRPVQEMACLHVYREPETDAQFITIFRCRGGNARN